MLAPRIRIKRVYVRVIAYIRRLQNEKTDPKFTRFADITSVLYGHVEWENEHPLCNGESIGHADVFYFRAVGHEICSAQRLVNYAVEHGIKVVDRYLLDGVTRRYKDTMAEKLIGAGVAHPATFPTGQLVCVHDIIEEEGIGYPCILKFSKGGRRGIGTFYLRNQSSIDDVAGELRRRREENLKGVANLGDWPLVIQEYIPNGGDYRAITVGGECLGIVKRGKKSINRLVLSSSDHGARKYKRDRWPRDVGRLAVEAASVMKVDISGVDIVRHRDTGELYVIEVNECPAFNVFERRTKVDVAEKIVSWLRTLA